MGARLAATLATGAAVSAVVILSQMATAQSVHAAAQPGDSTDICIPTTVKDREQISILPADGSQRIANLEGSAAV